MNTQLADARNKELCGEFDTVEQRIQWYRNSLCLTAEQISIHLWSVKSHCTIWFWMSLGLLKIIGTAWAYRKRSRFGRLLGLLPKLRTYKPPVVNEATTPNAKVRGCQHNEQETER